MKEIDVEKFRQMFAVFANKTKYPDPTIQLNSALAQGYVSEGCNLKGDLYEMAWYLMTAHLLWIDHLLALGQTTVGVTVGATVDKVSVTTAAPPTRTGWQYWLATTPFGMKLWAFLMMQSGGGWYIGGSPERSAFKGVAGRFGTPTPLRR